MSSLDSKGGDVKFKIGLVGESGVGKSCLLVRWVDNDFFTEDDKYTIGVDYKFKQVQVKDKNVKLQIYDTAGQERFRTVTASFYRGAHGILLVYDITQKDSFETRVEEWLKEIRNYTPDNTPIVLVGNKLDIKDKRAVDYETAKAWADKNNLKYFETSAKDGTNVNEAFMSLSEKIVELKFNKDSSKPAPTGGNSLTVSGGGGKSKDQKKGLCHIL
jgi:Ras-related protein Rab-1A